MSLRVHWGSGVGLPLLESPHAPGGLKGGVAYVFVQLVVGQSVRPGLHRLNLCSCTACLVRLRKQYWNAVGDKWSGNPQHGYLAVQVHLQVLLLKANRSGPTTDLGVRSSGLMTGGRVGYGFTGRHPVRPT